MGRTITACLKVTASEEQALTRLGGTSGKGLRVLLDMHLLGADVVRDGHGNVIGQVVVQMATTDEAKRVLTGQDEPAPPTHRHRRGEYLRSDYEAGVEMKVYRCTGCDKEMR
jgi:hypothetical protein